jgi:hypothetical protein
MVVRYSPVSDERSSSAAVAGLGIAVVTKNKLMLVSDRPIEIVICLGSSCFARGNAENLRSVKTYLEQSALPLRSHARSVMTRRWTGAF